MRCASATSGKPAATAARSGRPGSATTLVYPTAPVSRQLPAASHAGHGHLRAGSGPRKHRHGVIPDDGRRMGRPGSEPSALARRRAARTGPSRFARLGYERRGKWPSRRRCFGWARSGLTMVSRIPSVVFPWRPGAELQVGQGIPDLQRFRESGARHGSSNCTASAGLNQSNDTVRRNKVAWGRALTSATQSPANASRPARSSFAAD